MDTFPNIKTHPSRLHLKNASRVVIKCGTAILSSEEGHPSLTRLSNLVESVVELSRREIEVILVASGAVGCGKQVLHRANLMRASVASQLLEQVPEKIEEDKEELDKLNAAAAATGQLALMSLFDTLFSSLNMQCSQLLLVSDDFKEPLKVQKMSQSLESLIDLGIIPIINENDAVSAVDPSDPDPETFADNDALAALVSRHLGADLLIIMTDVDAVFTCPPQESGAKRLRTIDESTAQGLDFGNTVGRGRGGMKAKIKAALRAVQRNQIKDEAEDLSNQSTLTPQTSPLTSHLNSSILGGPQGQAVDAVLIMNGHLARAPVRGIQGEDIGTLVVADRTEWETSTSGESLDDLAMVRSQIEATQQAKQALLTLSSKERADILLAIADALESRSAEILAANQIDLTEAQNSNLAAPLLKRLGLSLNKLSVLAKGIREIAQMEEPIGKTISALEISPQLNLQRVTAPLGVLLIIFESRPDSLPQIAALSLRSGNGLILKGGREAKASNRCLHKVITETIVETTQGKVGAEVISLVETRAEIKALLELDDLIDLVVPRGGNALVRYVQNNTKIPVLGHADGVCHVYVDQSAKLETAIRVCVDAKVNYPAACNAMETILIHEEHVDTGVADQILRALRKAGVTVLGGPRAIAQGLISVGHAAQVLDPQENSDPLHIEYGDLTCACEIVADLDEAILHCNQHGSSHTESIVTEEQAHAERFLNEVDSACVFVNSSTRFADGFRLGLGAEVGISTSRIHARGPVGIEGLLTSKWLLRSNKINGHTVGEFGEENGAVYTHKPLDG